jgi:tRNA(Ile2) C34 agmatinyltransferase TiaS
MGLFSRAKCPIHRVEYSISSNGLEYYYYCKQCRKKARKDRETENEISELKKRIEILENKHQTK